MQRKNPDTPWKTAPIRMSSPIPHDRQDSVCNPPTALQTLSNSLRWVCLGAFILCAGTALASGEGDFFVQYKRWTNTLGDSPSADRARFIHFPLVIDGHPFTEDQFGEDAAVASGLFSKVTRERLRAVPVDEVQSFKDRAEFDAAEGNCPELPVAGDIFEVDVASEHGGPAAQIHRWPPHSPALSSLLRGRGLDAPLDRIACNAFMT